MEPSSTFIVGKTYLRRWLHETFGGQRQGGISTPTSSPFIFLFTGETGHQYGYRDGPQPDGTFWYTGEGQEGDMQLVRGNLAIFNHQKTGKELHLFEASERGWVRYIGPTTCLGYRWETAPDRRDRPRRAIVFELAVGDGYSGEPLKIPGVHKRARARLWSEPLEKLRRQILQVPTTSISPVERKAQVFFRSEAVKVYVLRRARGICEGCHQSAPFKRPDGTAYLEPHHIRRLADEGPDHPRWVAALCPNCHRRVHYGEDGTPFNEWLAAQIGSLED